MNEPTLEGMTQRLGRVERELRWWKLLGSAAAAFLGFVFLLGATG